MTLYKTNLVMKMEALLEKREKNHVMSKHIEEINDKQKCIAAKMSQTTLVCPRSKKIHN